MRMKYGIAVAGSHGKTTTTSMVAAVLARGGLDPTIVIGGRLHRIGTNARLGHGRVPGGRGRRERRLVPAALAGDRRGDQHRPRAPRLLPGPAPTIAAGLHRVHQPRALLRRDRAVPGQRAHPGPASCRRSRSAHCSTASRPQAEFRAARRARWRAGAPASACFASGRSWAGSPDAAGAAQRAQRARRRSRWGWSSRSPSGTSRRRWRPSAAWTAASRSAARRAGVLVVDDYGHHPTEIAGHAGGRARAAAGAALVRGFQPHRYTRTRAPARRVRPGLLRSRDVWRAADLRRGRGPDRGRDGAALCEGSRRTATSRWSTSTSIAGRRRPAARGWRPGDLLLTLGAGDVWKVGTEVLEGWPHGRSACAAAPPEGAHEGRASPPAAPRRSASRARGRLPSTPRPWVGRRRRALGLAGAAPRARGS